MLRVRGFFVSPSVVIVIVLLAALTIEGMPAHGQETPDAVTIPTVYRDAFKIIVEGKPDANGTFSMVFKARGTNGTEFTVNVVKGMGTKQIARDLAKELTLAAGSNYKVKQNGNKIVVKKANKKQETFALEMTNQKLSGVAIMIAKD
jgi:hypothetical protein